MGSKKTTIGYTYYMGVHFGLCQGPVDSLVGIKVGDRIAWRGVAATSQTFNINQPNLFGGEKKEGGIQGPFTLMMGNSDQGANAYLASKQGPMQPGYRGLCTAVYRGLVSAMSPYPKAWGFRVRRIKAGWYGPVWEPDLALITLDSGSIHAMNPAHIVYETVTNPTWGMGYPAEALDLPLLKVTAQRLYDEGFGLCLKWNKTDSLEKWLQLIADHVCGVISTDRNTGLLRFDLVRDDYEFEDLPIYDEKNILEMKQLEPPGLENSTNEMTIRYKDPVTNNKGSITLQSLASVQVQGRVVSETREYPGLPTGALAARVGLRDLRTVSVGLKRVAFSVNRTAYNLRPGQVIRFKWAADKLDIALRVAEVQYGTLKDGTISVVGVEDVFGLPDNTYLEVEPPGWVEQPTTAMDMPAAIVREASYLDLARELSDSEFGAVAPGTGRLYTYGQAPTDLSMNYGIFTRLVGTTGYTEDGLGDFCATGILGEVMVQEEITTNISLSTVFRPDQIEIGTLCSCGNELMQLTAWDEATGKASFKRGVGDSVPAPHTANTPVFFYDENHGYVAREFAAGVDLEVKLLTRTSEEQLAEAAATTRYVEFNERFDRPYPPGKVMVNGQYYPDVVTTQDVTLTWAHRDRKLQADQLIDFTYGSVGPEEGTTYKVQVLNGTGQIIRTMTGIVGTTWVYTASMAVHDALLDTARFRVFSVRGELESLQYHDVAVERNPPVDPTVVDSGPLTITTSALPQGEVGTPYYAQLQKNGGSQFPNWSVDSGLVPGLTLDGSGVLSGTPTTEGTFSLIVRVSGPPSRTITKTLTVSILTDEYILDGGGA
ncbi:tail protein [Stenotrophomonas phage vB_SmaS_DLP_3]|nr:tail protein [Stenotrophomonas phage vB_SmaS_DLP_3]